MSRLRLTAHAFLLLALLTCAASANPKATLGPRGTFDWKVLAGLPHDLWSGKIVIKLVDGLDPSAGENAILGPNDTVILDLADHMPEGSVTGIVQGFGLDLDWLRGLRERGEKACGCELADMSGYFSVYAVRDLVDLETVLEGINASPLVEVAYPECDVTRIPPPVDIPPPTPDFSGGQGYLGPAPDGIDAHYANTLPGGRGEDTDVVDIEADWDPLHEDLDFCEQVPGTGTGEDMDAHHTHHGTAVLGVMAARDNGYGMTGIVPDAGCHYAPEYTVEYSLDMARAILLSSDHVAEGLGVVVLEIQVAGPNYDPDSGSQDGLIPAEWEPSVFDAVRIAVASGTHIVEAAGNGGEDLDDSFYYIDFFDREARDSGAIIVGAGKPPSADSPRSPTWFTNWGSRIDLHGWGSAVYTTGYGVLWEVIGDPHQDYTDQFAGTSSASPIVAGAVAALAGVHWAVTGEAILPLEARQVLVDTGTPQVPDPKNIGPLPNLLMAIGTAVPICGDSIVSVDEACDDGNTGCCDGCSADCFSDETCGNSVIDEAVGEMCDDGSNEELDGCSANCLSDETCGNGYTDALLSEACDDGNTTGSDGCSADCLSDETCGNSILDETVGEQCDDGNVAGGDGCSNRCRKEEKGCGCEVLPGAHVPGALLAILVLLAGLLVRITGSRD